MIRFYVLLCLKHYIWEQPALLSPYIVVACDYLANAMLGCAIAVDFRVFIVGLCKFQMVLSDFCPKMGSVACANIACFRY